MKISRSEIFTPITKVVSFVLFFTAAGSYGFFEHPPATEKMQSFFNEHGTKSVIMDYPSKEVAL